MYRRWPSAKRVSNARELLPEPLKPVITISFFSGRSRSKFFRLLGRTPLRRIAGGAGDFNICSGKLRWERAGCKGQAKCYKDVIVSRCGSARRLVAKSYGLLDVLDHGVVGSRDADLDDDVSAFECL